MRKREAYNQEAGCLRNCELGAIIMQSVIPGLIAIVLCYRHPVECFFSFVGVTVIVVIFEIVFAMSNMYEDAAFKVCDQSANMDCLNNQQERKHGTSHASN